MDNMVLPKKKKGLSSYNFMEGIYSPDNEDGPANEPWLKGGEGYLQLKKDDRYLADELGRGFVEVNGAMAWTCVFSDIPEDVVNKYSWETKKMRTGCDGQDERFLKKEMAINNLLRIEECFADENMGRWFGIHHTEIIKRHSEDVVEICELPYINLGVTTERDYRSLSDACYSMLIQMFALDMMVGDIDDYYKRRQAYDKLIKEQTRGDVFGFIKDNINDYISWVVTCGNEAQNYARYARSHPPVLMIRALHEHRFTDDALHEICNHKSATAYYMAKTSGLDWTNIFNERARRFGLDSACPV